MSDIRVTSTSTEGSVTTSVTGEWELTVDATGENGPTPTQVLAADYASSFVPALRAGATRVGFDDIGHVEVEVEAALDDGDGLAAIAFDVRVEESLGDATDEIVARAEDRCNVHAALRDELRADVSITDEAF